MALSDWKKIGKRSFRNIKKESENYGYKISIEKFGKNSGRLSEKWAIVEMSPSGEDERIIFSSYSFSDVVRNLKSYMRSN